MVSMSFRRKLVLLLIIAAVTPVAFAGILSIVTSGEEMTARIREFQRRSAALTATGIDNYFADAVHSLQLSTGLIPFDEFPPADIADAVRIPYRQFDFANIVALMDDQGKLIADPAFEPDPTKIPGLENHEAIAIEDVQLFAKNIPLSTAIEKGAAFSPVYFTKASRMPRIALAIAFPVKNRTSSWVLAVELSFVEIAARIDAAAPDVYGTAFVVDSSGSLVYQSEQKVDLDRVAYKDLSIVAMGLKSKSSICRDYLSPEGEEMTGAYAPIPLLGYGLVVSQHKKDAFASVSRMRTYTEFWVALSLIVAIAGGVLFARGVSEPVRQLASGAKAVAAGQFDWQVPVKTNDELGQLSATFNQMSADLKKSFETIYKQNEEIARWNEELKQRVAERTRELRQAEEQILQSQKMAAVGELGAGIAHEINNPLTGVLGFAQLMFAQTKPEDEFHEYLASIVEESKRIRTIVDDLLQFTRGATKVEFVEIEMDRLLKDTLRLVQSQLEERQIKIRTDVAGEIPLVFGNRGQLEQAIAHIVTNAHNAMPEGGELTLSLNELDGGAVKVTIRDTGIGITEENISKIFDPFFTTKTEWTGKGLGLSVAHQIIEEHQGRISVTSQVGEGTVFTIILPGMRRKLHLD